MKTRKEKSLRLVLNKNEVAKLTSNELELIKGRSRAGCHTDQEQGLCPTIIDC